MTFNYLRAHNTVISRTKRDFEVKEKTFFFASQVLSFRHTKQTSKNVVDATFTGWYRSKSQNGCFKKTKIFFKKTNISYPLIRTHTLFVFREIWRTVFC